MIIGSDRADHDQLRPAEVAGHSAHYSEYSIVVCSIWQLTPENTDNADIIFLSPRVDNFCVETLSNSVSVAVYSSRFKYQSEEQREQRAARAELSVTKISVYEGQQRVNIREGVIYYHKLLIVTCSTPCSRIRSSIFQLASKFNLLEKGCCTEVKS